MGLRYKIAIIGAGYTAKEHIKAFQDIECVDVVGIYTRTKEKANLLSKEFNIPVVADSIENLYKLTKADLVVVTVNETSMKDVALECVRYPWVLFLEKPPGLNLIEAREIQQFSKKYDKKTYVALNRRFYSSTLAAQQNLHSLKDEKRFIHIRDQQDIHFAKSLGFPEIVLNYWMYANSIHLIDYFSIFSEGEVTSVKNISANHSYPGVVLAHILFSNGDEGLYEGHWGFPGPWEITVSTSKIRWELRPLEKARYQLPNERVQHEIEPSAVDIKFKPGYRLQAEEIVKVLQGVPSKTPSLEESLKSMQIICNIFNK